MTHEEAKTRQRIKAAEAYRANPEKFRARKKEAYQRNPDAVKRSRVRRYGIDLEDYEFLVKAQNGACGICKNLLDLGKLTHIDHNHRTGSVRGILCSNCNSGLGLFKDSPEMLVWALKYLRRNDSARWVRRMLWNVAS